MLVGKSCHVVGQLVRDNIVGENFSMYPRFEIQTTPQIEINEAVDESGGNTYRSKAR